VVKLRWQRGDDGRWQARGIGGKTYVVEHCEHGFAAGVQPPPFNLPLPATEPAARHRLDRDASAVAVRATPSWLMKNRAGGRYFFAAVGG
jgi:hypothetical protein